MKYMKAASALAVSVIAAGAAAGSVSPAMAAPEGSMSLNTGVQTLADAVNANQPLDGPVAKPLLNAVTKTAHAVNAAKDGKPTDLLSGAAKSAPLVGGLPLGG
ncbi:hypothetical protein [Streptomyces sp. H27-C3]|uniref:hypothetical protein n=1 Tax=Streptomyces sp. H27-C3 TaxID=3046305 RepID=UPI0024BB2DD0|nr:hypothetical protein [Streptomyces sp. H27-C3]MDJ0460519.1 hypothetical protein [Streptomyces sp. H27-C3]